MARIEEDREDLMKEAIAFVRRAEWRQIASGKQTTLFTGFKKNGAFSIYIDQDPVYQFDVEGKLRRAFVNGLIYRTEGETLARLKRDRSDNQSNLNRHDLNNQELGDFIVEMKTVLKNLQADFETSSIELISEINDSKAMRESILESLAQILSNKFPLAKSI